MAVQKSRKSRSKRGMRRSHHALTGPTLSVNDMGNTHRRHHIAEDGSYRGMQVIVKKEETTEADE